MTIQQLSGEQEIILTNIEQGNHVIVDAVAGSGKSTVVLSIAEKMKDKKILQMTYNSMLRLEVKEKVEKMRINNLKVHTFHSLAVRYYSEDAITDTGIRNIVMNNLPPSSPISKIDLLVIDEAQDMTILYFLFIHKFLKDMNIPVQIMILGDYMQGLYDFKGADTRFLTMAEELWRTCPYLIPSNFIKCTMKMSYRITNPMCSFINDVMLGEQRLEACRDGEKVVYIRNSRTNIEKMVIFEVTKLIDNGALPSDIFILGASVKGVNSNIRKMENVLVLQGIPCHVPMFDTEKIDEKVIGGKVVFSSFHSVKGRQRKYVFVVGFDNGYMDFYARNLPKDKCPNTLYVAPTRASEKLFLLESDNFTTDRPLEFLKMGHYDMMNQPYVHFKGHPRSVFYVKNDENKSNEIQEKHYITPTELIKFVPETVLDKISPMIETIYSKEDIGEHSEIPIPNIIKTKKGYEEVSDLTGIALQSMYYDYINYKFNSDEEEETMPNILYDLIQNHIDELKENEHYYLREIVNEVDENMSSISDYLYLANVLIALQEKLYFKLKQIDKTEYTWLTPKMVAQCNKRLENTIGKECMTKKPKIEKLLIQQKDEEAHEGIDEFLSTAMETTTKFRFTARVDLITEDSVWENKCTSTLSLDHKLQLVIYAWIWKMTRTKEKKFKLFNIKSGEVLVLNATMEQLNYIMIELLKGKYFVQEKKSDAEFLAECMEKKKIYIFG
jgi:hypothetical protein